MRKNSILKRLAMSGVAAGIAVGLAFGAAAPASAAIGDTAYVLPGVGITYALQLDNGTIVYCLDMSKKLPSGGVLFEERSVADYAAEHPESAIARDPELAARVFWILSNGYPAVSAAQLSAQAGLTEPADDLTAQSATQLAVWALLNGVGISGYPHDRRSIAQYLIDHATPMQSNSPDGGSITITPGEGYSAVKGQSAGPFIATGVDVTGLDVSVSDGASIVDATGAPTKVTSGIPFWVAGAADTATISATGKYSHISGNIWVPINAPELQEVGGAVSPLILDRSATLPITWAPAPIIDEPTDDESTDDEPAVETSVVAPAAESTRASAAGASSLAATGASSAALAWWGIALAVGGCFAAVGARRRRRS